MISFENDYSEGAHEKLLKALVETNMIQESGYGEDEFSKKAMDQIREVIQCPTATIRFLVGGTQTNQIVINTMLDNYQGVIAADSGHVSTHEAGAIEFSGHKVLTLEGKEGKLDGYQVSQYLNHFYQDVNHEHMVFPGMVYISYPTEYGTLYTREELELLSRVCRKHEIPLYIDGARLGYGLMSDSSDLTIADIAKLSDVFYIGGTKIGALCGEAVVFTKNNEPKHFVTRIKQQGALLAKGRLLGIQFLTLFSDNLYFELSAHAIKMANKLKQLFIDKGYQLYIDSPTNQQFFILSNKKVAELQRTVKFSIWESYDDAHQIVRFATSWATRETHIQELSKII
ncbi:MULTISPECIES: low specificity L-threonine aldolase [unclassified Enterococcus]|uniref:threonine aldolase family protein n=1 Tax=unclassified Enterococcus TaxID=2608891 RepID=UPI001554CA50|nr:MULTISPECIES: low specificity L-threonine aldolase [unclassified Enterococcus]MBS7576985.1 low specificity L-threonine aldolase [Enterococcus sp. MMGLQ5-2]MBS7584568.1 low specificity L-threonine aldolase [Enterococcus sp. MMGLQ5-1]NPD12423.1 low specificity L-threonine aldolase [Enterococcus sp. MMGLQ5-1]NPD36819.1 low specificity L-threonine aldolase [Enterococcus sp. MMGLQ5-2]